MSDLVLREDRGSAAILTLNRPDKLNSLNVPVFEALNDHVAALEADPGAISVVVLRGAGRCFSAGHDLGDIAKGEKLPTPNFQAKVIERLASLPLPVISAVHGHCYTGALELALDRRQGRVALHALWFVVVVVFFLGGGGCGACAFGGPSGLGRRAARENPSRARCHGVTRLT